MDCAVFVVGLLVRVPENGIPGGITSLCTARLVAPELMLRGENTVNWRKTTGIPLYVVFRIRSVRSFRYKRPYSR